MLARPGGGAPARRAGGLLDPERLDRGDGDDRATGRRRPGAGVVRCIRANGAPNLPDPQIDADDGQPYFPAGTPSPPERALRACQPIVDRLPPAARGEETRPLADIPALVRFARCMRDHGLTDFPDPGADGTFRLAGTDARR
jgi:hypothetical protein